MTLSLCVIQGVKSKNSFKANIHCFLHSNGTHSLIILSASITPPDLLNKSHSTLQSEEVCPAKREKEKKIPSLWHLQMRSVLVLETCLPLFKPAHSLLDEDDLVSDGRIPLNFQLHVMVVLI